MTHYFQSRTIIIDGVETHLQRRTEEEVLADLTNFYMKFCRVPTKDDFKKALAFGESFTAGEMCHHFDCSWSALLKKVGLKAIRKPVVRKTDEEMLADLRKLYAKLKRPLLMADVTDPYMASQDSYLRRFKSFANACAKADVPCGYRQRRS